VDPWGLPYLYRTPGKKGPFDVYSLGADRKEGGEKEDRDVGNW
jgi:general secretion pathway protein G